MKLRDYQSNTIKLVYQYIRENPGRNPCIVLPTAAGKSLVIAEMCRDVLQRWPESRLLMLTHVKELIEQNASKMRAVWPDAPLGIYSSGLGKKQLGREITFAGIQSIWNKALDVGHVNVVFIDECHLVPTGENGRYREFLAALKLINPRMRVIGLTATPWRLGAGLITEGKDAIFDDLIEPVSIADLVEQGFIAPLRSKHTDLQQLEMCKDVRKSKGDFVEGELGRALNTGNQNDRLVTEIIRRAGDTYRHWLIFCAGLDHARAVAELLNERGVPTAVVHGEMSALERTDTLTRFKRGELKAVTNMNVLTTGFDFPDIDLVAFARPTMSPTLYVQMAGRGCRLKSHTDHCMVLDFGGLVSTHGPITDVKPPKKKGGKSAGEAPVKTCPACDELVAISVKVCPTCMFEFPEPEKKSIALHNDDIMGAGVKRRVRAWMCRVHFAQTSGKESIRLDYDLCPESEMSPGPLRVSQFLTVWNGGVQQDYARRDLRVLAKKGGGNGFFESPEAFDSAQLLAQKMNMLRPPTQVTVKADGKFFRVRGHKWLDEQKP